MPNGKPIATDLQVLEGFAEPFEVDGVMRDERMAKRWGCHIKQVYALWDKRRFQGLIDSGVTQRSGWLTDRGEIRLVDIREEADFGKQWNDRMDELGAERGTIEEMLDLLAPDYNATTDCRPTEGVHLLTEDWLEYVSYLEWMVETLSKQKASAE